VRNKTLHSALTRVFLVFAGLSGILTIVVHHSWSKDNDLLKIVAFEESQTHASVEERWSRSIHGSITTGIREKSGFLYLEKTGANACQRAPSGGDCADKSRLLSALLNELGVESTLAMLYPCDHCAAVHTQLSRLELATAQSRLTRLQR
jgi:hypothetical protein